MKYTSPYVALAQHPPELRTFPTIDYDAEYHLPEERINRRDGSLLRLIPAGAFILGSAPSELEAADISEARTDGAKAETPQCQPVLPAFYFGVFAVTNEQFALFLTETQPNPEELTRWLPRLGKILPPLEMAAGYRVEGGYESHPIVHISWFGADAYAKWAGLRLPREIEWEKAARGPEGRIFPWGDDWDETRLNRSNQTGDEADAVTPVDAHLEGCSPYGIFQMVGNVEEWCSEPYDAEVYTRYSKNDLQPPGMGHRKVLRGGSFGREHPQDFRCALRQSSVPGPAKGRLTGLRCASSDLHWCPR
jgi:formylglycine-generating enzyme required for sulfatase activity